MNWMNKLKRLQSKSRFERLDSGYLEKRARDEGVEEEVDRLITKGFLF